MNILGIIPARYQSTRFPGKPLVDIRGKSMIQRVYEQSLKAKSLSAVVVATDDQRIYNAVKDFGGNVIMTSSHHLNGTERCAEALALLKSNKDLLPFGKYDFIVNIQGDEPCIHPGQIEELTDLFNDLDAAIVTQAIKETDKDIFTNPNTVKVTLDNQSFATDFFRNKEEKPKEGYYLRHIGIYGFKAEVLESIIQLAPTLNEKKLKLEQLRWLDHQYAIKVGITSFQSQSVDIPADLEKIFVYL